MGEATTTEASDTVVHHRTCHLCEAMCGLDIHVSDGRVVLVRGDREDVFSKGYLCPKGASIGHVHHHEDRLDGPVIRRGGDPATATWDPVSWEEAFAEVQRRLMPIIEEHGRDSVAVYLGNPSAHSHENLAFGVAMLRALGTRNVYSASTVDQMPKHVSSGLLFGDPDSIPVPDLDRTDFLLMLGANPMESNGSLCTAPDFPGRLRAITARGGRLVVVDPRRTRTAELGEHLPIRPGTDALLLLALANVVVAEGLARPGRLEELTDGLDLVGSVVERFTPERVAPATGIPADTIAALARDLAAAPSAAVYGRIGTHTTEFGTLAAWAVDLLNVLTGNLDRPGGAMFAAAAHTKPGSGSGRGFRMGRWSSRVRGIPEHRGELPVATLPDEILTPGEGQVRALITVAGNPVASCPDSARMDEALGTLEFMVSVDPWRNETTRRADVILPPPGPLARSHYDIAFAGLSVRNIAQWSAPIFERGERPAEWEILATLAAIVQGFPADTDPALVGELVLADRLSRAASELGRPVEELDALVKRPGRSYADMVVDAMIRVGRYGDRFGEVPDGLSLDLLEAHPHGIDYGPLQPELPGHLKTASGRIELIPEPILGDLPRLEAVLDRPSPAMVLVGRRHLRSNNSWMHNIPVLVKGRERCTLQIHPEDADRCGVADGSPATVRSRVGEVTVVAEVTDAVMPGVVSLPHGWGHDLPGMAAGVAANRGVNSNLLTDPGPVDPLSGNAALNAIPVEVHPG